MKKSMNVIIRVSDRCNQDCSYCYVDRDARLLSKISLGMEAFHSLYSIVLGSGLYDCVTFVWHGGEPTLMGAEYLDKVIGLQHKYLQKHQTIQNSIQTNATIITPEIVGVLAKHQVQVGVSLDAPPEVNNELRTFWNGKPTLARILSDIKALRDGGLDPGAICVLTKKNYTKSVEIYAFFKQIEMSYQYNPMYSDEGVCQTSTEQLAITSEQYAQTLIETYNLYFNDPNPNIDVTDIQHIIGSMMAGCSQNCLYSGKCEEFMGILPNGDIYLCDLFYKPEQKIGNLSTLTAEQLINSPVLVNIASRPANLMLGECRGCEWWNICRGGCSSKSRAIFGDAMRKDPYCETRKMLFSHVKKTLTLERR